MSPDTSPRPAIAWSVFAVALLEFAVGIASLVFGVRGGLALAPAAVFIALGVALAAAGYFTFRLGLSVDPAYVSPEERDARLGFNWQERLHPVGPDLDHDVRLGRPYFLMCVGHQTGRTGRGAPLSTEEAAELAFVGSIGVTDPELARSLGRVKKWVAAAFDAGQGPITDVFVLSHGWHRNLYGSVGTIACIHSRRDTANGFFYPLANHGRRSAGFGGLAGVDSLSGTVSLDLTSVCCDGPLLAGGGHGDIFKDDVIYAAWGVITRRRG